MRTHILAALTVAMLATACTSATPNGSATGGAASVVAAETTSGNGDGSRGCPPEGCPVPDCGSDEVLHVSVHVDPGATGTQDVSADLDKWISTLVGQGEGHGIPTPPNKIAFLVTGDDTDLALLWYVSDGNGGWLRAGYTACASALLP